MKFLFVFMFLFIIIAPLCYFIYIFRYQPLKYKIVFVFLSAMSLFVTMIKLFIHPYSSFFLTFTVIVQFFMLIIFITFIFTFIYHGITFIFHKTFHKKVLILCLSIGCFLTSVGYFTHYNKTVQTYNIQINKVSSLSDLKLALISDLHAGTGTDLKTIEELVTKLNQNSYDLVCFVGDLFDESTPSDMVEKTLESLSHIQTQYGLYAINGNHEHYASILNSTLYEKYNIHHLSENYVCVDGLFNIVGREDVVAGYETPFESIIQNLDTTLPTIVLDHNPKRYHEIIDSADLQLSGHTHAGQIFPATIITQFLYDNDYGLLQKNDFSLIVTSGYGSWGFPFRLLTKCEYVEVKISFLKK